MLLWRKHAATKKRADRNQNPGPRHYWVDYSRYRVRRRVAGPPRYSRFSPMRLPLYILGFSATARVFIAVLAFACGGGGGGGAEDGNGTVQRTPVTPTSTTPPPATGQGEGGATNSPAPNTETTPTPAAPRGAALETSAQQACASAVAGDSECLSCVCVKCAAALDTCATTPGCREIMECVATSGCIGAECYCGDAGSATCLAGRGNGPCKDVVLAAPGGREPDTRNRSAGPASDAANAVGSCASDEDTCGSLCVPPSAADD
jgi:hypothetical protein